MGKRHPHGLSGDFQMTSILTGMNEPLRVVNLLMIAGFDQSFGSACGRCASASLVQTFHTGTSNLGSLATAATRWLSCCLTYLLSNATVDNLDKR